MEVSASCHSSVAVRRSGARSSFLFTAATAWMAALTACDAPPTDIPPDLPHLTVVEPAGEVVVGLGESGGSVRVRGNVTGEAPLTVVYSVDGGPDRAQVLEGYGQALLDLRVDSLPPGSHSLSLVVRDSRGRSSAAVLRSVLALPVVRAVPLVSGAAGMFPTRIGPAGEVVGYALAADGLRWNAWKFSAGTLTDLSLPGEFRSAATGLNAKGDVVGYSVPAEGSSPRAVLWRNAAAGSVIEYPGVARAVNDLGDIVGVAELPGEPTPVGFVRRAGGVSYIRGSPGEMYSPAAVDSMGRVAGTVFRPDGSARAFLVDGSGTRLLPTLGGERASASAMNERGVIVGYSDVPHRVAYHAFVYEDGSIRDLTPPDPQVLSAYAYGVNRDGVVVGELVVANGSEAGSTGFASHDGKLRLLQDIVGPEYLVVSGYDVNDRGEIIAAAVRRDDVAAVVHAVLIAPPGGLAAMFNQASTRSLRDQLHAFSRSFAARPPRPDGDVRAAAGEPRWSGRATSRAAPAAPGRTPSGAG